MDVAEELIQQLLLWLDQRRKLVDQLLSLAQELESLHFQANHGRLLGSSVAVTSALAVLTVSTGGLLLPAIALGGTVVNQVVKLSLKIVEDWKSSSAMKKAKELIQKDEETSQAIQKLQEMLHAEGMEIMHKTAFKKHRISDLQSTGDGHMAFSRTHRFFDQQNPETEMLFSSQMQRITDPEAYIAFRIANGLSTQAGLMLNTAILMSMACLSTGTLGKRSLKLVQHVKFIGMRTLRTASGVMLAGLGLTISVVELIHSCVECIRDDNVTVASQALRNAAEDIKQATDELENILDNMKKSLRELVQVRDSIMALEPYKLSMTKEGQHIIDFLKRNSDPQVAAWFEKQTFNISVIDLICLIRRKLQQEREKQHNGHVHIILVGHGEITSNTIPARCLMPLNTIRDVIFYSPWNCAIDAKVAVGITTGTIRPIHRDLKDRREQPLNIRLPPHWNKMAICAQYTLVPEMILSPVCKTEPVWKEFIRLGNNVGLNSHGRILMPYLTEQNQDLPKIPLYIFNLALALVSSVFNLQVTVHWSGCLCYSSGQMQDHFRDLCRSQYAYTPDGSIMTLSGNWENLPQFQEIYEIFKKMFNQVHGN